jgi:hypothetical protein
MLVKTRDRLTILVLVIGIGTTAGLGQAIQGTDTGFGGQNSITGTVLAPSGQRTQRGISVRLTTMTKGDRIAVTDDVGNFAFRGLPNGDYQLVIDKEKDYEPFSQSVSVFQMRGAPGGNYMVSIRLKSKPASGAKPGIVNAELAGVSENAVALYRKAADLGAKADHKGAIEQLKLAIAEDPKFVLAYNDLGVQYLKLNDLGRADDAFRTALNIDRTAVPPLQNHGLLMFNLQRYVEAEQAFRDLLKLKEGSAVGHFFLGQSLAYQGKWDEAEKELVTGLSLGGEPMAESMSQGQYLLGLIYGMKGNKKRQIAAWEAYLKLEPKAPNAEQIREKLKQIKGT